MKTPIANSQRNPFQQSRRTFLRGAGGVAMALPWLESTSVWGSPTVIGNNPTASPRRFAALFMANGVSRANFWAKPGTDGMELGSCLQPLKPLRHKLNFISGLFNKNSTDVGIHPGQTGNLLSGAALQKGAELRGGISVDQRLANTIGRETVQPSLVLGCEQPVTGYHETNFSMAYGSHISWQNATSPVPMEVYPSLAFDSLFENRGHQRNVSILDRVSAQAHDLSRKVSVTDKAKLDEYLTSVRAVERRIEALRAAHNRAGNVVRQKGPQARPPERPENGLPEDIRDHMRLMCDIIALAFQTDKTRIATLLLNRDISGMFYPFLGIRTTHHSASHRDTSEDYEKITRYYVSQLAYLAKRLDAMPEGEGTVLDHSCIMWINNMWSGSKHDSTKVPLLTAGGLGGKLQTGRILDYQDRGNENRKLCSLYLSLMNRMGDPSTSFGDAEKPLADV
jgi:hypothetical protein